MSSAESEFSKEGTNDRNIHCNAEIMDCLVRKQYSAALLSCQAKNIYLKQQVKELEEKLSIELKKLEEEKLEFEALLSYKG